MNIDNLLDAMSALCPENIPEIESLPVVDLKVGDECVLVWSKDKEVWKVKAFCSDGDVDIVDEKYNAHMSVPSHELRLAKFLFNDCEILDYPEDYTSPNCKKFDERVK